MPVASTVASSFAASASSRRPSPNRQIIQRPGKAAGSVRFAAASLPGTGAQREAGRAGRASRLGARQARAECSRGCAGPGRGRDRSAARHGDRASGSALSAAVCPSDGKRAIPSFDLVVHAENPSVQLMLHAGTHGAPAESVVSLYVKSRDLVRSCQRHGQCPERAGVRDSLVRPVPVVELLELPQGVQKGDWFQMSVRSSSSRRQVCTHRSMIEFILGIRTPLCIRRSWTRARR